MTHARCSHDGRWWRPILSACCLCLLVWAVGAEEALVRFSDGQTWRGELEAAPGVRLIIHDGQARRELQVDQLAAITVEIESEEMLRRWRFIEPGKPAKEEVGQPRPLRRFQVRCQLRDGSEIVGHLQTAAFLLRSDAERRKIILASQLRGQEGEAFDDLVYPQELRWVTVDTSAVDAQPIAAPVAVGPVQALVALSRPDLARLEGRRSAAGWALPTTGGAPVFLAAQGEAGIVVTWPVAAAEHPQAARFAGAIAAVDDFFDRRELIALWQDPGDQAWYSLVLLQRERRSTSVTPWRLSCWRWIEDAEDGRLQVVGRMHLFRGLPDDGVPTIDCSSAWWQAEARCHGGGDD